MVQSRDEAPTDPINRTEYLEGNGKEMIIADDFSVFAFGRRFSS